MANLNAFSDNVEMALGYASRLAQKLRTSKVGSEHLLYGLAKTEDSTSSKILAESGVTAEAIEMILEDTASMFFGGGAVEMTPEVKEALRIAQDTARNLNHSFIGTEHLLYAVLSIPNCIAVKILMHYFNVSVSDMKMKVLSFLQGENTKTSATSQTKSTLPESLLKMGIDVNLKVKEGKIDPVVGREEEIERIIQILCRKTKNNPVLIGEAGVGKTAVVEGLAQAIVSGAVPELLANKTVYSLEIGSLMAGTKYRGSMEEKLKNAIETIIKQKNIIVFIDELHTLAQSGSEKGEISP
ncbi:MAG: ATP-dependent Clp protease ATP-binding subunit, partial [Clostridia bacterium]|nr:ATP-dependent Clp protease ATP-binding subunit [Clostridia bacterium]